MGKKDKNTGVEEEFYEQGDEKQEYDDRVYIEDGSEIMDNDFYKKEFIEIMKGLRNRSGIDQGVMADALGMHKNTVYRLESGRLVHLGLGMVRSYLRAIGYDLGIFYKNRKGEYRLVDGVRDIIPIRVEHVGLTRGELRLMNKLMEGRMYILERLGKYVLRRIRDKEFSRALHPRVVISLRDRGFLITRSGMDYGSRKYILSEKGVIFLRENHT